MAASSKPILVAEYTIDKEPSGGGGRRFQEETNGSEDEIFGRIYLNQKRSLELGSGNHPKRFKVTVEALD